MKTTSRHPRVPFIRRAKAMAAVAVVAVLATTAAPALAATPPPAPPPTPVRQGQTITLFQVITEECVDENFGVVPSAAGIVTEAVDGIDCRIQFTASSTYFGPVTVSNSKRTVQLEVTNKNASIGATFTPKAAPGPCIQIVSGATVPLGEIEIGSYSSEDAPTTTEVRSCGWINIKLTASVSAATSGVAPNVVTMQPQPHETWPLKPNKFGYLLSWNQTPTPSGQCGPLYTAVLTNVPQAFYRGCDTAADLPLTPQGTRAFSHSLMIGAGSSGAGQEFSTTVTLTAMAA
ncbi:MAG: hypothetical protein ACOYL9_05175 [Ilumatobacteraceae bacterium]